MEPMTAITDEQRRKVAAKLRLFVEDVYDKGEIHDGVVLSVLEIGVGPHEGYSDVDDVLLLADLIDRPTCTPEVGWEQQTCSECGMECIGGWDNYCSNCGAEVVREEGNGVH